MEMDDYWYPTPEDYKIAKSKGITKAALIQRNYCGWTKERALSQSLKNNGKLKYRKIGGQVNV